MLRADLPELLDDLAGWAEGADRSIAGRLHPAACRRVGKRLESRAALSQVVTEFLLLRDRIVRVLLEVEARERSAEPAAEPDAVCGEHVHELARLEDGLDMALADVVERFVAERDRRASDEAREAKERLARSEATLRHAGEMAHLGAWWFELDPRQDPGQVPLTWSDEAYRIFGYAPGEVEVTGALFYGHVHPDDRPKVDEAMARALTAGRPYAVEHRILRKDGAERIVVEHADVRPTGEGERVSVMGAVQDVTDQRRAEEALRESDQRKTEFLAVLSHELRNPLAPIRNSIELLERAPAASEPARRAREVIRRQSAHLARLVDDLLDVTRIARGKIQVQPAIQDLREIVRRVCEDHDALFEQGALELRLDLPAAPVWVEVDTERFAQVAGNLLQNANKFTPAHGVVSVVVRARAGTAELRVCDTGIGMDPAHVARMFEPFAQAEHGLARTRGGLGLGLALAKALVELQGGTIRAHSDGLGRGSEFAVTLPLATPRAGPSEEPRAPAAARARLRVLVIEDSGDAARSLADILELEGHDVLVARDGRGGIALAREHRPDLVLCDIGLPDVDGYTVARTLRLDPALASTRLVAMSGWAQPEDRQRALEAGFDAHLAKPTPMRELEELLGGTMPP